MRGRGRPSDIPGDGGSSSGGSNEGGERFGSGSASGGSDRYAGASSGGDRYAGSNRGVDRYGGGGSERYGGGGGSSRDGGDRYGGGGSSSREGGDRYGGGGSNRGGDRYGGGGSNREGGDRYGGGSSNREGGDRYGGGSSNRGGDRYGGGGSSRGGDRYGGGGSSRGGDRYGGGSSRGGDRYGGGFNKDSGDHYAGGDRYGASSSGGGGFSRGADRYGAAASSSVSDQYAGAAASSSVGDQYASVSGSGGDIPITSTSTGGDLPVGSISRIGDRHRMSSSFAGSDGFGGATSSRGRGPGDPSGDHPGGSKRMRIDQDGKVMAVRRQLRNAVIEPQVNKNLPREDARPGRSGRPCLVSTNYVGFRSLPNSEITLYDVNCSTGIKARFVPDKYKMLKSFQSTGKLPVCGLCYDGRLLYSAMPLFEGEIFVIEVKDPKYSTDENGRISFRKVATCVPGTEQWYKVLNIIINLGQQLLGQRKYGNDFFVAPSDDVRNARFRNINDEHFTPGRYKLKDQFELLQGYSISFQRAIPDLEKRQRDYNPIMHVSGIHRLATIQTILNDIERNYRSAVTSLPGRSILTRYNNKTYTIVDILEPISIDTPFSDDPDCKISYRQYFKDRYHITLTRQTQPFVMCKQKRADRIKYMQIRRRKGLVEEGEKMPNAPVKIPAEVCYLIGFSDDEKMKFQRDKDFNQLCRKQPDKKAEDVRRFTQFINSEPAVRQLLNDWNLTMLDQPIQVEARTLDICYNRQQQFRTSAALNNGAIRIIKPDDRPTTSFTVGIFVQSRSLRDNDVRRYIDSLNQSAQKMGFQINVTGNLPNHSINEGFMKALQNKVDMVLCLIDDSSKYKEIKTLSIEHGVLSQVVRGQTAQKLMTAQKVAMQMACKVGLIPWRLSSGLPSGREDFMIVGIDVFSGKGSMAVQTAVFSLDRDVSKYYTYINCIQGKNVDCVFTLDKAFQEALSAYRKRNNRLPSRIFVYRDGVSDSELVRVEENETKPLIALLNDMYGSQPFHLVVTVVKKRINQRFFVMQNGRAQNVPPGTVIDKVIVKPNWHEYYIVPQESGQGTATPTNFNVIFNNRPNPDQALYLSIDDLQRLSFALTHIYFNWAGTIRVPAPVQYAHKCAFLLGQCGLSTSIHERIKTNLFYL